MIPGLLAGTGDENAAVRIEPVVKPAEAEVAARANHAGEGHEDAAARIRPPRILAQRENHTVLLHIIRIVGQELGQDADTLQGEAFGDQAFCCLFAGLAIEERRQLQVHLTHTLPELESLGSDVRVDVPEVVRTDRRLNERDQPDVVVDGRRKGGDEPIGVVQECLEHSPADAPLLVLIQKFRNLTLRDAAHDTSSFSPAGSQQRIRTRKTR